MTERSEDSAHWSKVKSLLEEVGPLTPEQRVEHLRSDLIDPSVRSEVEELLALEGSGDALLGVTQWRDQLAFGPGIEFVCGMVVGNYRIVKEIGRGGMGAVYLAERSDGVYEQRVALKVLHAGLRTPKMIQRFLLERQILAGLVLSLIHI